MEWNPLEKTKLGKPNTIWRGELLCELQDGKISSLLMHKVVLNPMKIEEPMCKLQFEKEKNGNDYE